MKNLSQFLQLFYLGFAGVMFLYLIAPSPAFPEPPAEARQSQEPGDVLDLDNRRAYFINWSREEIVGYYREEFDHVWPWSLIPSLRLGKYPPEEAEWHVYDPLLSSYLEELVYPFRESIFISGYEPEEGDDKIALEGETYQTKYTVRYYQSAWYVRLAIYGGAMVLLYLLVKRWGLELYKLVLNK